jgi:CcmD family protein
MKVQNWILTALVFFFALSSATAQSNSRDFMRSMGKMYVVVAVIVAVFMGIVLFLVFLDRRLTKIENQIKDHG